MRILVSSSETQTNCQQKRRTTNSVSRPAFTPANCHLQHLVSRHTSSEVMHDLIRLAQKTKRFTVDAQFDVTDGRPSLIQIEFVNPVLSVVALVEMCYLPADKASTSFWLIRSLLRFVLQPSNTIYSWGRATTMLAPFVQYGLFTLQIIHQLRNIDVERTFRLWYRSFFSRSSRL